MISLCMIVKNEEEVLPRALASWDKLADQLVVVDTGSSDHTREIALSHGAQLLHYDWREPGHKGEARNVGLDAARGDWVVVQDADEIVREPAELRGWLEREGHATDGVNVLFENYDQEGRAILRWYQMRAFRRNLYRYRHREHELPWFEGDPAAHRFVNLEAVFEHRPPPARASSKIQPMIDRLLLDVQEHPDDASQYYFLHRQYLLAGNYGECIEWGQRYLALHGDLDPCECYGNISSCHLALGDTQEALRWLYKAAAEQAHRKIWWLRIAELHMTQGRWQLALAHLRLAGELWPTFEWQWQPESYGPELIRLIDKCQAALQATHHGH